MNSKNTRLDNIKRKIPILDREPEFYKNIPLPSWVEISIIDACNRTCSFCPKSDPNTAPNTYQRMEMSLINKLCSDLRKIKFTGSFCLSGYGEPTLHKNIFSIIDELSSVGYVEMVTNGDSLNSQTLLKFYQSKLSKILISLYDGEHQLKKFKNMVNELGIPKDFVILRNTWYSEKDDFGLLLTNRAGTVSNGKQQLIDRKKKCYYPSYTALVDWNGDVFLCPHDWQRRSSMGNIMQRDFFEIWSGSLMNKYRRNLLNGKRNVKPCSDCNAEGTVHGFKHAEAWTKYLK